MWIFTPVGFFSVVQADAKNLMVRARIEEDLDRLINGLEERYERFGLEVIKTPRADYPFRVILPATLFARYMHDAIAGINYANFKDEVAKTDPTRSHRAYLGVWSVLRKELVKPRRIQDVSVDELEVSLRVMNALDAADIETIGQLLEKTRGEVYEICGRSTKCVKEVEAELTRLRLRLADGKVTG